MQGVIIIATPIANRDVSYKRLIFLVDVIDIERLVAIAGY